MQPPQRRWPGKAKLIVLSTFRFARTPGVKAGGRADTDNYWIDGYHRLFMMAATGLRNACMVVRFHFSVTSVY